MSTTRGRTQRSGKTDVHMWGCLTTIARRWRSPREEDAHFITRSADGQLSVNGGDEGTRTPDPLLAKEVLSQLSYIPTPVGHSSLLAGSRAAPSGFHPCI